jgi:hypothetical protein
VSELLKESDDYYVQRFAINVFRLETNNMRDELLAKLVASNFHDISVDALLLAIDSVGRSIEIGNVLQIGKRSSHKSTTLLSSYWLSRLNGYVDCELASAIYDIVITSADVSEQILAAKCLSYVADGLAASIEILRSLLIMARNPSIGVAIGALITKLLINGQVKREDLSDALRSENVLTRRCVLMGASWAQLQGIEVMDLSQFDSDPDTVCRVVVQDTRALIARKKNWSQ